MSWLSEYRSILLGSQKQTTMRSKDQRERVGITCVHLSDSEYSLFGLNGAMPLPIILKEEMYKSPKALVPTNIVQTEVRHDNIMLSL